jgi:group I intron endonuclease
MVVYQTTNLINDKKYIGKDKNNNPNYIGSGTDLKKAIKEYGKKNFKKEILEYCNDIEHLVEREKYWLELYDVENNDKYYNKTNKPFGNSGLSDETKAKIKQSLSKREWDDEWSKNISKGRKGIKSLEYRKGNKHGNYQKPKSKEHKNNISKSLVGKKHSAERCENIRKNRFNCIESKRRPVVQVDLEGNEITTFSSITEAKKQTNIKGIANVLIKKAKTAGGYIWKYK